MSERAKVTNADVNQNDKILRDIILETTGFTCRTSSIEIVGREYMFVGDKPGFISRGKFTAPYLRDNEFFLFTTSNQYFGWRTTPAGAWSGLQLVTPGIDLGIPGRIRVVHNE
jgi:hypothetical protein